MNWTDSHRRQRICGSNQQQTGIENDDLLHPIILLSNIVSPIIHQSTLLIPIILLTFRNLLHPIILLFASNPDENTGY
jgi:hypothetical protein